MTEYLASNSNQASTTVSDSSVGTSISVGVNVSNIVENNPLTISGTLSANDGSILAGVTIEIGVYHNGAYVDTISTSTNSSGDYAASYTPTIEGTYDFEAFFTGITLDDTGSTQTCPDGYVWDDEMQACIREGMT